MTNKGGLHGPACQGARVSAGCRCPADFAWRLLTETGSQAHVNKLQQIASESGTQRAAKR